MTQPSDSIWRDQAKVDLLKKMWWEGAPTVDIAREVGAVSRNSVISMVRRLRLGARTRPVRKFKPPKAQRRAPFKNPSDIKVQRPRIGVDKRMTMTFDVPCDALTDLPPDHSPNAIRFLKRKDGRCRWPLNDVVPIAKHMVCGSQCYGKLSYCAMHYIVSIGPSRTTKEKLSAS